MQNHRYTLERGSRKHVCPSCSKKRFVRYFNYDTGKYVADHVGRCDREQSCGYHFPPRDYLKERGQLAPTYPTLFPQRQTRPKPTEMVSLIPPKYLHGSLKAHDQNHFITWLNSFLSTEQVKHLIERFVLGTSKHWQGATVFWQIDRLGYIRTGKVMLYDLTTGRRIKQPFPHQTWVHSLLKKQGVIKEFELRQCLFGEHQLASLPKCSRVALVESEKTAILMTALLPHYTWVACGGLQMLTPKVCEGLRGFEIVCFPDTGCLDIWKDKATKLEQVGFQVHISDLLERKASEQDRANGWDLADYYLPHLKGEALNEAEQKLALIAEVNPHILRLMERFSLTQTVEGQTVNLALVNRKASVNISHQA